jgi:hypothetical protein
MRRKALLPFQNYCLQAPVLHPEKRWFIAVAGYGSGKTSCLTYMLEYYIKLLQGKRDGENHKPRIMLAGVTLAHLQKTTLAYFLEDLENSKSVYTYDKKNNIIHVGDVDVLLIPLQNPEAIQGFDVCAVFADEVDDLGAVSNADDITFNAVRAVNERCRQVIPGFRKPFLLLASTSQGQKGLYRVVTQFNKAGTGYVLIRGRTADNIHLDRDYVEDLYRTYSPRERRVFLDGEFLALASGRVCGDFDWDKNYVNEDLETYVKPDEDVFWAQDFNQGYHRGCVAILRHGIIYIVKRYEFPDIREAPKVARYDFPTQTIRWIPDTTAKDLIAQFGRELRKYDIRLVYRTKNPIVEDSVFLVNKLFYTRRLIIGRGARETAEAAAAALRDKNNEVPKGVGPLSPIHDLDSLRMVSYYLASNKEELLDIRRVTIGRHQEIQETVEAEGDIIEERNGYVDYAPRAIA